MLEAIVRILDSQEIKATIREDLKDDSYIIWVSQIGFIGTILVLFHVILGFRISIHLS